MTTTGTTTVTVRTATTAAASTREAPWTTTTCRRHLRQRQRQQQLCQPQGPTTARTAPVTAQQTQQLKQARKTKKHSGPGVCRKMETEILDREISEVENEFHEAKKELRKLTVERRKAEAKGLRVTDTAGAAVGRSSEGDVRYQGELGVWLAWGPKLHEQRWRPAEEEEGSGTERISGYAGIRTAPAERDGSG